MTREQPCRPPWCLEKAREFIEKHHPLLMLEYPSASAEELLANLLDEAYLRGRREERELQEEKLRKAQRLKWEATEAWIWVGDGDDDLESMSRDMVVVITAGDMKKLLEEAHQRWLKRCTIDGLFRNVW